MVFFEKMFSVFFASLKLVPLVHDHLRFNYSLVDFKLRLYFVIISFEPWNPANRWVIMRVWHWYSWIRAYCLSVPHNRTHVRNTKNFACGLLLINLTCWNYSTVDHDPPENVWWTSGICARANPRKLPSATATPVPPWRSGQSGRTAPRAATAGRREGCGTAWSSGVGSGTPASSRSRSPRDFD